MSKFIRYIGSKEPIIDFLIENFNKHYKGFSSFGDMFAGTNVVSSKLIDLNQVESVESFDMSKYSEILSSFVNPIINEEFISYITELDNLALIEGDIFNEFSINGHPKTINHSKFESQTSKSRMFFTEIVGKKIDTIKTRLIQDFNNNHIDRKTLNQVLALLLKYADSNAHTTGVYGAYLKNEKEKNRSFITDDLISELRKLKSYDKEYKFTRGSILDSTNNVTKKDILYMDPPYTTRRYENNYHVLDYIADIDFNIDVIKYNTKSGTPDLSLIDNPFARKKDTYVIFEKMITTGIEKCNCLFISYSNQGLLKEEDINNICVKHNLSLVTEKIKHKKYKSHDVSVQGDVYEILWVIKKQN